MHHNLTSVLLPSSSSVPFSCLTFLVTFAPLISFVWGLCVRALSAEHSSQLSFATVSNHGAHEYEVQGRTIIISPSFSGILFTPLPSIFFIWEHNFQTQIWFSLICFYAITLNQKMDTAQSTEKLSAPFFLMGKSCFRFLKSLLCEAA